MKSILSTAQYNALKQAVSSEGDKETAYQQVNTLIKKLNRQLQQREAELWTDTGVKQNELARYQHQFRELESLYALLADDQRQHFYITIPVADRPTQLKQCLHSLLKLCQLYNYGGILNHQYQKIHVIIADDSANEENRAFNHDIAEWFNGHGLNCEYFGLTEQIHSIKKLEPQQRISIERIIGDTEQLFDQDISTGSISLKSFSHKGASITRNICYLHLNEIHKSRPDEKKLFYFIDSDQQFCVNSNDGSHDYAISYFHHLNTIFEKDNVAILTGKVVGDPPVSPAVMAARFEDDVLHFLDTLIPLSPDDDCHFHQHHHKNINDAAYHDMSGLFGFEQQQAAFDYRCRITGRHNNRDCLNDFAARLNGFFHGEHITRDTAFHYTAPFTTTTTARTIYTGNYIFRPACLQYFISFATLNLRMAGPVLGRLLKTRLADRFVSANLPMLHTRTVNNTGRAEFRAGVENHSSLIDLSHEFEKQYFGDVLLFSIEKLCRQGFPQNTTRQEILQETLLATSHELLIHYADKHEQILHKIDNIKTLVSTNEKKFKAVIKHFNQFIDNILHNFGNTSKGFVLITSAQHREKRLREIENALTHYPLDLVNWYKLINQTDTATGTRSLSE